MNRIQELEKKIKELEADVQLADNMLDDLIGELDDAERELEDLL